MTTQDVFQESRVSLTLGSQSSIPKDFQQTGEGREFLPPD